MPPTGSGPAQAGGQGEAQLPQGSDGADGGAPDAGWEVSNEVLGSETGGGSPNPETSDADDGGDGESDALARALAELDGEILEERIGTGDPIPGQPGAGTGSGASDEGGAMPPPLAAEPAGTPRAPIPIPPDQPDARDDDVVARQLREAAMAETDPKLREDLWEEYRRYKSGL